ncbi:hypothetical protein STEG23_032263 [Scotinomys teguina]
MLRPQTTFSGTEGASEERKEAENYYFQICEELCWYFDEDCNGSIELLLIEWAFHYIITPVHEHGKTFPSSDIFFNDLNF